MPRRAVAQQQFTQRRCQPSRGGASTLIRNPAYRTATVRTNTVTNSGTVATAPVISYTAVGSWASVYFRNVTAGRTVWVNQALVNGDVLSVDFAARTVTVNGVTVSGALSVDSRWWELAPGANTVQSNVPATITHYNATT